MCFLKKSGVLPSVENSILLCSLLIPLFYGVASEEVENAFGDDAVVMDLVFLTKLQKKELHSRPYHIVNISLQESGPFVIHLKKFDFYPRSFADLEDEEFEKLQCVYSGSITSSDGRQVGLASLSSCHYENAFEGFILLNNKNYHITPLPEYHVSSRMRREAIAKANDNRFIRRNGFSRPAQKYKVQPRIAPEPAKKRRHRTDMLRIPAKTMSEARNQMIKDQEGLQDEDYENAGESDYTNTMQETMLEPNEGETMTNSTNLEDIIEEYAVRKQNNPIKRNNKVNVKRRPAKIIELALFTDEAFYKIWRNKHRRDTELKINQYLLTLVNNMNHMYHQPSLKTQISFRLVEVVIQKDDPRDLRVTKNSERYLTSFCNFQGKRDTNGKQWDHAMMITGLDMQESDGSSGTIGLAYTSSMCLRYYSCSLIEYRKGFETAFTATHEIGHSLGMDHDGEDINKNCSPEKFIMAAMADSGQVNWSKCSVANLKNFLGSGDPRPGKKDPGSVPHCLTKRGQKAKQINYKTGAPGLKFTLESQCETVCHKCTPMVSGTHPYNNICFMLHCKRRRKIIEAHPALEGTRCGNNNAKMCRNGKCQ